MLRPLATVTRRLMSPDSRPKLGKSKEKASPTLSVPVARPETPRKFTATSRKVKASIVPLSPPDADAAPICR